jgi:hypothetical protein
MYQVELVSPHPTPRILQKKKNTLCWVLGCQPFAIKIVTEKKLHNCTHTFNIMHATENRHESWACHGSHYQRNLQNIIRSNMRRQTGHVRSWKRTRLCIFLWIFSLSLSLSLFPVDPNSEHRTSVKCLFHFSFLILGQPVELLGWGISPS